MDSFISIQEWIIQTLKKYGNITSQRDLESYVKSTGYGATKFSKWMKKSGLRFNRTSACWTAKEKNGEFIVIPSGFSVWEERNRNRSVNINSNKKENFSPDVEENWPLDDFERATNLSKYETYEIHELAWRNQGIGFKEFVYNLYPSSTGSMFNTIREILDENQDFNLYDLLQTPIENQGSTISDLRNQNSNERIFDWGNTLPQWERKSHHIRRFGFNNNSSLIDIRFDLRRIWNYEQDGYTINEVCFDLELPYQKVKRWTDKMVFYNEKGILEDWLELVETLNSFSKSLSLESFEDEKNNEIYLFIRKITENYLKSPEKWTKRPRIEHLHEIFHEINNIESINELDADEGLSNNLVFLGNHLDSNSNFQVERMLNFKFYEPLFEQSVLSQVKSGANGILIDVGVNVDISNIIEFSKLIISKTESWVFVDGKRNDSEFLNNIIPEMLQDDEQKKLIFSTNDYNVLGNNGLSWVLTPEIPDLWWPKSFDLQKAYFDSVVDALNLVEHRTRLLFRPVFTGFTNLQKNNSLDFFNPNALKDYFELIQHISTSDHIVVADFRNALQGINSIGNISKIFHNELEKKCIEFGAKWIITDVISREQNFKPSENIITQIHNLFNGVGHEFLDEHSVFNSQDAG